MDDDDVVIRVLKQRKVESSIVEKIKSQKVIIESINNFKA